MPSSPTEEQRRDLAQRVVRVLNGFGGTLHGARVIIVKANRDLEANRNPLAAKYAIQIAFGAIALTMRKFEELWSTHIPVVIQERDDRPEEGTRLVGESRSHNLGDTASQLIAHYTDHSRQPLSLEEVTALIRSNGWDTEEQLATWVGPVIEKLYRIRDKVMSLYGISSQTQEG